MHSEKFRSRMVAQMLGPTAVSANALSKRVGIGQPTLSKWLRDAKMSVVSKKPKGERATSPPAKKAWSAEEKLRVVVAAAQLDDEALGELLRREGLHESDLKAFRSEALAGLSAKAVEPSAVQQIKQLRRDLDRKQKALKEAEALLTLRKKLHALWGEPEGDADNGTGEKNE